MPSPLRPLALIAALIAALAVAPPAAGAAVDDVHPIVFPVIGSVTYTDDYEAPRSSGRTHNATDLMGHKMQELVAADDGHISFITIPEASYGYMLRITADDGWVYSYVHMNNDTPGTDDGNAALSDVFGPDISQGARVRAGQLVGYMGDSGNAEETAPHLHFEMRDPAGNLVNPYYSLNEATRLDAPIPADSSEAAVAESPIARLAGPGRIETAVEASKRGWPDGSGRAVLASATAYAEALPASVLAARHDAPLLLVGSTGITSVVDAELDRLGTTAVTVVGSVPSSVDGALAAQGIEVSRLGSAGDMKGTSVAVAHAVGGSAGTVVLVNSDTFADGISAAALASGRDWPVLLTSQSYVYQESVDTWRALGIHTVYLVGGPIVIGENIHDWLVSQGLTVRRLAGANRYGTSTAVAGANESLGGRSAATMLFATGRNYPDALASGALAARLASQFVLVDGWGAGHDGATASWVTDRASQVATPYILGGPAAVGGTADQAIQGWLGL